MGELAHRRPQSVAEAQTVDYTKALNYLGLSPGQPAAQALILVCQRYRLDPLLGHISLYDGKPYVHFAGYLHIANDHKEFDGIECVREWETDTHFHATVRVHRRGRSFPSERTGRSAKLKRKKDGSKYEDEHADAKAFAQACRRALRMCFNVDHPEPAEDHGETPAPAPVVEVARMVDGQVAEKSGEVGERLPPTTMGHAFRDDPTVPDPTSPPAVVGDLPPGVAGPGGGAPTSAAAPHQGDEPAAATPTQGGDASDADAQGVGPKEQRGVPPTANPAAPSVLPGPTPPIQGPSVDNTNTEPGSIVRWASQHGLVHSRVLAHLRREHPDDFGDLRSVQDLWALGGESSQRAIAYLEAAFEAASEP